MRRNTTQRNLVLEAVCFLKNHATADEVYAYLAKEHPSISRATVYRNLNLLVETGAIGKVAVPDGADRFDHINHHHYHATCIQCGMLMDVSMEYLEHLEKNIAGADDFIFLTHDIMFKGLCKDCQESAVAQGKEM